MRDSHPTQKAQIQQRPHYRIYLQWHFRINGHAPPAEPILRDFRTIEERDALLDYARTEPERDAAGRPATRWGGRTKLHPVTGEAVPDEADQVLVLRPVGGKPAAWPEAEFIVGNPPFTGAKYLRENLGDGYTKALWAAYPKVPQSVDLAMFFGGGRRRRCGQTRPGASDSLLATASVRCSAVG